MAKNHIRPAVGSVKLSKLNPRHVQGVLGAMIRGGAAPRSVHQCHAVMSSLCKWLVKTKRLGFNPATDAILPKLRRAEIQAPSGEAVSRLFDFARGTSWELPIFVALAAGLRRSELLPLRWEDIDFQPEADSSAIHVVRTLQKIPITLGSSETRLGFLDPKSEDGMRWVGLTEETAKRLRSHKAAQNERRMKAGEAWQETGLVFDRGDGSPLDPDRLGKVFKSLARKAGIPDAHLHGCRHAFITNLVEPGVDWETISQ